jgi:hypothetical protein
MPPEPALSNRPLDPSAELLTATASRQKRFIDALNEDAAILCHFDAVRDLNDLTGGSKGIGKKL